MKYNVQIEETLCRIVEVEASSPEDAEKQVLDMYMNEEIVLDDGDLCGQVEITAMDD